MLIKWLCIRTQLTAHQVAVISALPPSVKVEGRVRFVACGFGTPHSSRRVCPSAAVLSTGAERRCLGCHTY